MNRNLKISCAVIFSCFVSAYGMDIPQSNLNQTDNNAVVSDIVPSEPHPRMETDQSFGVQNRSESAHEDTIHLQIIPENFSLLNENGLQIIDREVNSAYRNLSKWQQERLRFLAENGQFDAYKGFIKFWHVIESWTYPAAGLAQLVNTVLPLVVITKGDNLWLEVAMCISGVLGLFFGQISVYAGTRISEQTAIHDILQVLRRKTPVEASQHSINDQRDPLDNRASTDLSISSAEEAYMGENA